MIGRGLIKRPGFWSETFQRQTGKKQERKERFFRFHNAILEGYRRQQMSGDKNTLFKMKELGAHWRTFADADQRPKKPKM